MSNDRRADSVGDIKSPPLKPDAAGLRHGVDQAMHLPSNVNSKFSKLGPLSSALPGQMEPGAANAGNCKQTVWITFFFDGTGNNMDADVGTAKHSNVAKLYRIHAKDDQTKGVYRIYVPGVGTYFREVRDDGASALGLGTGSKGDARLAWALEQFDKRLEHHIAIATSPATKIIEVNIAVFGFSRGAALARAFVNRLLKSRAKRTTATQWFFTKANCPLRIRFMGLFDTVASVGLPMSANNMNKAAAVAGLLALIDARLNDVDYVNSRPQILAFAERAMPGADPSPGVFDGHSEWGGELAIPEMVEEVQHFVAAHELRNSFPLDSISRLENSRVIKPAHFYESVFPGVHSDVGGSYRPGEGGRNIEPQRKLGLIPLHQMYKFAIAKKVPLLSFTACDPYSTEDFDTSKVLIEDYRHYIDKIGQLPVLGPAINAHMRLYYAWRFRAIRQKKSGDRRESNLIAKMEHDYNAERVGYEKNIGILEQENDKALRQVRDAEQARLSYLQRNYGARTLSELATYDKNVRQTRDVQLRTRDALLREKAKLDALPNMNNLTNIIAIYDAQLLADARAIYEAYTEKVYRGGSTAARADQLRPHYKAMMDAYEDEYIRNNGLKDTAIIRFFDEYVHDSLSGFAKDATLPSDPRVVYLGGDEKYRYAARTSTQRDEQLASNSSPQLELDISSS